MAVPADPEDPLLRKWVKVKQNPIVKHPEDVGEQDMRDPTTAWQLKDGSWVFTVGAVVGSSGRALQYKSKDLIKWELQDTLLHTLPESGMWECVDFFPVDYDTPSTVSSGTQKYVFKTSMVADKHDYYTIGTYDEVAQKFIPDDPKRDVGSGFRYDYGKYYASKSLYDPVKNRHVVWAWVNESDTEAMDIAKGWSSVLVRIGLPSQLSVMDLKELCSISMLCLSIPHGYLRIFYYLSLIFEGFLALLTDIFLRNFDHFSLIFEGFVTHILEDLSLVLEEIFNISN
jgi:sucrose-6-phosphate hydrolase SacC (GH32 family)